MTPRRAPDSARRLLKKDDRDCIRFDCCSPVCVAKCRRSAIAVLGDAVTNVDALLAVKGSVEQGGLSVTVLDQRVGDSKATGADASESGAFYLCLI